MHSVAGGPAGCAVAGRLAKADPNLQVLLVEAGPNNKDDPTVFTPGVYPRNMRLLESDKARFYYDTAYVSPHAPSCRSRPLMISQRISASPWPQVDRAVRPGPGRRQLYQLPDVHSRVGQ